MALEVVQQQTVAALAAYRDDEGQMMALRYPEVEHALDDALSKSFLKAVLAMPDTGQPVEKKVAAIASAMSRNGFPKATPEIVSDMLNLAYKFGQVDIDTNVKVLVDARNESAATQALEQIAKKLKTRQITVAEALAESQKIGEYVGRDENEFISTDDWQIKAPKMFEDRRRAVKSGKLPTFPVADIPSIGKYIPYVDYGTLTMIIAATGVGKSIFARRIAHWWAEKHGRNVLYCSTELTNYQQVCRDISARTGISYDELLKGNIDNDALNRHLTPYKSGGRVIYWEASGKPLGWVLAEASKYNADIIYDYADMAVMGGGKNSNRADQFGDWLQELKAYLQHAKACGTVVQQMDKASSQGQYGKPSLMSGKGSSNFAQRPNYGFVLDFPELDNAMSAPHPNGVDVVVQDAGEISKFGELKIGKNSFGNGQGARIPVFRWGERSIIMEYKKEIIRL